MPEGISGWVLIISMFSQADGHFLGNIPIPGSEKNARRDLIGVDWGRVTPMYSIQLCLKMGDTHEMSRNGWLGRFIPFYTLW